MVQAASTRLNKASRICQFIERLSSSDGDTGTNMGMTIEMVRK